LVGCPPGDLLGAPVLRSAVQSHEADVRAEDAYLPDAGHRQEFGQVHLLRIARGRLVMPPGASDARRRIWVGPFDLVILWRPRKDSNLRTRIRNLLEIGWPCPTVPDWRAGALNIGLAIYSEPVPPITWMVMSRDVSHSIRVVDQPVAIAVMILDVDTGLIRGLSVAKDLPDALSQSVERALNKPADSLPPGYPQRVLAAVGLGDFVAAELGRQPGLNLIPPIDEIVPGDEAEEIFDLFVESFS
jgi:hypothetical protein